METENFQDHGEEGEIWFGRATERRVLDFIAQNYPTDSTRILDVGCGNGHLSLQLKQRKFQNVAGIDYSSGAVELSRLLLAKNGFAQTEVSFHQVDLLQPIVPELQSRFDLIVDKGTFDAICLGPCPNPLPDNCKTKTEYYANAYIQALLQFIDHNSSIRAFIITSCNWTKTELIEMFKSSLQYSAEISHPAMRFGGAQGQTVTSLVFTFIK